MWKGTAGDTKMLSLEEVQMARQTGSPVEVHAWGQL